MNELIARLERATGPDRELDEEIYRAAVNEFAPSFKEYRGMVWATHDKGKTVPKYTASIDAAMTLVLDRLRIDLDDGRRVGDFCAAIISLHVRGHDVDGRLIWKKEPVGRAIHKDPAIALCIAALKARRDSQ